MYIEDIPLVEFMYLIYLGCTSGGVYVPYILRIYLWRSLCTLYIEDIPLVEFMYLVY